MSSRGSRLVKIIALTLLAFAGVAPATATETTPSPATGVVSAVSATSSPGTGEAGETQKRPNVGDEAPNGHEFGEQRNLLTDEGGLIALGLAALIGTATAIFVMRARRKSSLY